MSLFSLVIAFLFFGLTSAYRVKLCIAVVERFVLRVFYIGLLHWLRGIFCVLLSLMLVCAWCLWHLPFPRLFRLPAMFASRT